MKSFELLPNGVRKHFDWGYSEVYADFSECFTDEELDQVILHLTEVKTCGALSTEEETHLASCVEQRKKRRKRR